MEDVNLEIERLKAEIVLLKKVVEAAREVRAIWMKVYGEPKGGLMEDTVLHLHEALDVYLEAK